MLTKISSSPENCRKPGRGIRPAEVTASRHGQTSAKPRSGRSQAKPAKPIAHHNTRARSKQAAVLLRRGGERFHAGAVDVFSEGGGRQSVPLKSIASIDQQIAEELNAAAVRRVDRLPFAAHCRIRRRYPVRAWAAAGRTCKNPQHSCGKSKVME
jgi:hypothetical protein